MIAKPAFGFSIVLGLPFSPEFHAWALDHLRADSISWRTVRCLHATIVNCTLPRGRSCSSERLAMSGATEVAAKMPTLCQLISRCRPFILKFSQPTTLNGSVVLPSQSSHDIKTLKHALQDEQNFLLLEEGVTMPPNVIGIDKFSASHRTLADSLAVTLGTYDVAEPIATIPSPAPEMIDRLRLVFYRNRELSDMIASAPLRLGANEEENLETLKHFFRKLEEYKRFYTP